MIVIPSKMAQPHFLFHWPTDCYILRFLPNDLERAQLCAIAMKSRLKFHFPLLLWMNVHSLKSNFVIFSRDGEKSTFSPEFVTCISAAIIHIYMQKYLKSNAKKKKYRLRWKFSLTIRKDPFRLRPEEVLYSECARRKQNFTWLFSSIALSHLQ